MRDYKITRNARSGEVVVLVYEDNKFVKFLPHVKRHSPDGFEFGYAGSGPADLALSILHDCCGPGIADDYYQQFKRRFIVSMTENAVISYEDIMLWFNNEV